MNYFFTFLVLFFGIVFWYCFLVLFFGIVFWSETLVSEDVVLIWIGCANVGVGSGEFVYLFVSGLGSSLGSSALLTSLILPHRW